MHCPPIHVQNKSLVFRRLGEYSLFLLLYYDIRPRLTLRLFSVCNLYEYLIRYSKLQLVLGIHTRADRQTPGQSSLTLGKIFEAHVCWPDWGQTFLIFIIQWYISEVKLLQTCLSNFTKNLLWSDYCPRIVKNHIKIWEDGLLPLLWRLTYI